MLLECLAYSSGSSVSLKTILVCTPKYFLNISAELYLVTFRNLKNNTRKGDLRPCGPSSLW